jgi:FeS assembly protein IscX
VSKLEKWPHPIHWEATYEIVLALNVRYADVNLDDVSLENIFEWTLALPGFEDDPALANDEILMSILQEWYEERYPL